QLNLAWNHRRMDQLDSLYAPDAHCHAPGARELQGVAAIRYLWTSLLACMSDAQVFFLHAVGDAEGSEHTRQVALVWRMIGRHDGPGLTHEPSGVRLQVLGISQFLLRAGRIVEEWTLFDELALLKQIFVAQRQTRQ
ncbi:MAG: ester cyclase, partial [Gammaproteobacteria bacterium]|nr:ester cyclase [Gammaproteobacteria bacterium]